VTSTAVGPRLWFDSGESTDVDLVVGADGVRSAVRRHLSLDTPRFRGVIVYRSMVDIDRLPPSDAPRVNVWLGPGHHCVWYPVGDGRRYIVVAAVAVSRASWGSASPSWRAPAEPREMRRAFAGWHPEVGAVLGAVSDVTCWALYDRPVPDRWSQGGVTLVGDAAHAMLPFGAHGGNQAIESAATLATCLRRQPDLAAALEQYGRLRASRLARVTESVLRNADDHHLSDGAEQRTRDEALADADPLRDQGWLFGHDAEAAVTADLARAVARSSGQ
jgi:salicylate hydroxylase